MVSKTNEILSTMYVVFLYQLTQREIFATLRCMLNIAWQKNVYVRRLKLIILVRLFSRLLLVFITINVVVV